MMKFRNYGLAVMIVFFALALAACSGGGTSPAGSTGASKSTLPVTGSIDQVPVSSPAPTTVPIPNNGWDNANSAKLPGLTLIAQLDSSGPDAWDHTAHPLVYITSAGGGYGGLLSANWIPSSRTYATTVVNPNAQAMPGIIIIDATTKQPVISTEYFDVGAAAGNAPITTPNEPHGLGVSADGKWIYVQGVDSRSTLSGHSVTLVVNARTLKVDKIINARLHHAKLYHDANLNKDLVLFDSETWAFALDPSNNNTVAWAIALSDINGSIEYGFCDPSGKYFFGTIVDGFSTTGGVAVVDLATTKVITRINTDDSFPNHVEFSVNGKFAYVSGTHDGSIARINMSDPNPTNWVYDKRTTASVVGPYAVRLNWNDTVIFAVGKEEGQANKGEELGIVPVSAFGSTAKRNNGGALGPLYLNGCIRPDHAIVHPDPAVNELWISCNSSFENVVVKMGPNTTQSTWSTPQDWKSFQVIANIPSPRFASSHSGAFVKYNADWTGSTLSDTNGLHGSALAIKKTLDKGPTS